MHSLLWRGKRWFCLFFFILYSTVYSHIPSYSLVAPSHPVLQEVAKPVTQEELTSEKIQHLIQEMYAIAKGEKESSESVMLVGLAAPQVGVSKQIILADTGIQDGMKKEEAICASDLTLFINPKITWASEETSERIEGCYSTSQVFGSVARAQSIKIDYMDEEGGEHHDELFSGFPARVLQHEIDHLLGIRMPDKLQTTSHLHWIEEEDFAVYDPKTWEKNVSQETWTNIKEPQMIICSEAILLFDDTAISQEDIKKLLQHLEQEGMDQFVFMISSKDPCITEKIQLANYFNYPYFIAHNSNWIKELHPISENLQEEFLLINISSYKPRNLKKAYRYFIENKAILQLSENLLLDSISLNLDGSFAHYPPKNENGTDLGFYFISKKIFNFCLQADENLNETISKLAEQGYLFNFC